MTEPSDALRGLATQGRQLHAQYLAFQKAKQSAPANAALGTDLLDFFFDLSGYKRAVARIGRGIAYSSVASKEADVRTGHEAWERLVRSTLQGVSVVRKQVPREPNSRVLLKRFSKSQDYARVETRLEHGVRFLEELAEERVLRNEDLATLRPLPAKPEPSQEAPREGPLIQNPLLMEGPQILHLLDPFPSERQAIQGALGVYQARTPDFGRQALSSCRNAVENLTKLLSGEGDWNAGLPKVLPGDAQRKIVRQAHVFLSTYGTHATAEPDLGVVEMGVSLTFVSLKLLLKRRTA